jgi:NAD(P)-dependent dehydrogenase (short-subunit alcohol dehydrogenase family)
MARLAGKVCVITGAAGGIGAATAEVFAREGAVVVGVDLREHSVGELSLSADLVSEDAVASLYAQVAERYGRVDVLFNNAGISPTDDASVLDTTLEAFQRVQDANNSRSSGVSTGPGHRALTRTPRLANSTPSSRDSARTAPLEAV